jgi:hypothetical protein
MHYVICIDGTWNAPGQNDTNPLSNQQIVTETNVLRVFRGLTGISPNPKFELGHTASLMSNDGEAIYFPGVGTTSGTESFEGFTGAGTAARIVAAYQFLIERYKPGDKIFGFGFSRGAFAVRSLAGFINHVGLVSGVSPNKSQAINQQYGQYIAANNIADNAVMQLGESTGQDRTIHFLGLWDTVSAIVGKGDRNISPLNVRSGAHALALDETRRKFPPEYWDQPYSTARLVKEVWFCGAHANVGGGYSDDNLSNIAFFWVLKEAGAQGLNIDLPAIPFWVREDEGGILRSESHRSVWKFFKKQEVRQIRDGQRIHESVIDRIRDQTQQPAYTPKATLIANNPWETINNQRWRTDWMEPWGFPEAPGTPGFKQETQTMEIPNELAFEVSAMVQKYYDEKGDGAARE